MVYTKNDGLLNKIYPVGSIYMSTNDISPEDFLGGTWERWGQGRVPVGVDESDEDFEKPNLIGGEKTHTLNVNEMPAHRHNLTFGSGGNATGDRITWGASQNIVGGDPDAVGWTGDTQPHNNLQPYITCYMWKRTA